MQNYPKEIRINLLRQKKSGLIAAVSEDLPGLMTVGTSIDEIEERLPFAIQQIIAAQYGEHVNLTLYPADDDDFSPLSEPRIFGLEAA